MRGGFQPSQPHRLPAAAVSADSANPTKPESPPPAANDSVPSQVWRDSAPQLISPPHRRILVLFGADWDDELLPRYTQTGRYTFYTEGFDLFNFPSNARLMWFDLKRFLAEMERKYAGRIDAVVSSNEQFGAIAAALLAERLGLPGPSAETIVLCQHKLEAHHRLQAKLQHLLPDWIEAVPYTISKRQSRRYPYPLFVRPLKATFSVLARQVNSAEELRQHLSFWPWEKHIIKRLVRPYNDALDLVSSAQRNSARTLSAHPLDAHHLVLTPPMAGLQINVDGYAYQGRTVIMGICDEVMYPEKSQGLFSFLRFETPSRFVGQWREQIEKTSKEVIAAYGFDHGFFNLEFFLDAETGKLKLIEINPRLAAQLAEFYRWTLGFDVYEASFAMACNQALPALGKPKFGAAASFIWRSFDGTSCPREPRAEDWAWLAKEYPQACLKTYTKQGNALKRDVKWLGSHRWASLNLPSATPASLKADYERICMRLQWPAPY